ncbi:MAG: DUF4199 family protein [Crocinitomicaceae bacterium]
MNSYLKYPIIFAVVWFVVKCILFFAGMEDSLLPGVMINMLLLLASVAYGLFLKKKSENYAEVNFLDDMKVAIKSGMAYVAFLTFFIYAFYAWVDPGYAEKLTELREKEVREYLDDEENLKKAREENQNIKDLSKEDIIDLKVEQSTWVYSPFYSSTFALLSMMTGVFINSLLVVLLFRKVLFREMEVREG